MVIKYGRMMAKRSKAEPAPVSRVGYSIVAAEAMIFGKICQYRLRQLTSQFWNQNEPKNSYR